MQDILATDVDSSEAGYVRNDWREYKCPILTREGFRRRLDTKVLSNTEVYTVPYGFMASTTINRWKLLGGYLSSRGRNLQLEMSESRADSRVRLGLQASSDYLPTRTNFIDLLFHWVCWMMGKCLLVYISQSVLHRMVELGDALWQKTKQNKKNTSLVISRECSSCLVEIVLCTWYTGKSCFVVRELE